MSASSPSDVRSENPFDRFDLDPLAPADVLTERLREIAEDAADPGPARAAWEELTLHAHKRVRFALTTFVDAHELRPSATGASPPSRSEAGGADEDPRHARTLPRLSEDVHGSSERLDPLASLDEDPLLDESHA